MPHSDDFGVDDDDTAFLAAATQVEASQHGGGFEASPRPAKRRRVRRRGPRQVDGASSDDLEWSETDDEGYSLPTQSSHFQPAAAAPHARAGGGEENDLGLDRAYYFPGELDEEDKTAKKSKYKIHIPKNGGKIPDMIFTQTQAGLDSSPSRIRGAVWKRPKPPPPPAFNDTAHADARAQVNGQSIQPRHMIKQTILNGFARPSTTVARTIGIEDDAMLAARLQAEEDALSRQRPPAHSLNPPISSKPLLEMHEELADLPSDAFSSSSAEKSPPKDVIEISSQPTASQAPARGLRGPQTGLKQMTIFGQPATQDISASQATKKKHAWPLKSRDEPPTHHQLEREAMETWVYPTNLGTIRDYQYNIISRSLFHNTLVALPTGLGKTFIAATIMLNYYRWTTNAQIVFMAPTKPLIAQQMDACYHIVGIPRRDTVLMTGETTPGIRAEEWLEKRVFFMTPQTVINDLKTGISDPKRIVLLVVDEAHKATGSYAYTEVVAFMRRFNSSFRVLALTATPGSTIEAVQAVVDNLGIARVELRTESSLDIRPYTHEKQTDLELFDYSDEQALIMEHMSKVIRPTLEKLNSQNAYWARDPMQLTAFGLTTSRKKWMASDAGRKAPMPIKGMLNACFTVLSQLAHSIGLLKNHGIGPFYSGVLEFQKNLESGQSKSKTAQNIVQHEDFVKMTGRIRGWTNNPDFIGHPKLEYLREVVLNHFLDAGDGKQGSNVPPSATRIMVFASFRDSTEEICRVLKRNEPMIRPHVFVGQAASSSSEGMNQKKQNEVIQDFKSGKYNTLVATSIGEEGLDIGDVDLIVCYDASSSPIRMLQRIGRTGRKRTGKVVLLLMRGKEENDYAKAQDNYAYIQKSIADTNKYNYHDEQSPRIVPKEVQPVVDKRLIDIPIENSQPVDLNEKSRRARGKGKAKRPPKKFHMPDGVRTSFTKASKLDDDDDEDPDSEAPAPKRKNPAKKSKTPAKAQAKKVPMEREPEVAQLPYLEDVLLSGIQQKELERKYAHTADEDGENIVRAPDVGRFPEAFRELGGTKYVQHGKAAERVSKALRALREVDDDKVSRMKQIHSNNTTFTAALGDARTRLVSPDAAASDTDNDLPVNPLPAAKPTKKPRGRPRKKQAVQHTTSYGSAAVEGDESEPDPTPADMRIGTQGIDLGSRDTSGEEDDEEPDSELDAFIAKSDEIIETISSSLPGSQEVGAGRAKGKGGRGLVRKKMVIVLDSDQDGESGSADEVVSDATLTNAAPTGRKKKKVVEDSDSA
ncbi:hypothetical protein LTR36_003108 [Oleoguttula mirabilis]|uniref:ATP-dependent DNA helicase n=1 Tax=Oleoguttula mirabilis TaxID=1507867 RepID=A0AAV9JWP2_9PEZI|nr:hypothetical protein LTR36_003108 [Oleoguttula mirabilis]